MSEYVNLESPTANMYGCEPCPKCGSKSRCPYQSSGKIECDDCGYKVDIDPTCSICDGSGKAISFHSHFQKATRESDCPHCHGTGRANG